MRMLLVTGASGFLGSTLCRLAHIDWHVVAVGRYPFEGVHHVRLDLAETGFAKNFPVGDAIVHLAAEGRMGICEESQRQSRRVNVEATQELALLAFERGIPFVFTSTDLVFDGRGAPYAEDAKPHPISEYGIQKAEAESVAMEANPDARILRLSLLYDVLIQGRGPQNFLQAAINNLKSGKEVTCYHDEWRTPLWVVDAARAVMRLLAAPSGIYHAGGPERMSRLEMVQRVAAGDALMDSRFRGNDGIKGVSRLTNLLGKCRPEDVSLTSGKLRGLGWVATALDEVKRPN